MSRRRGARRDLGHGLKSATRMNCGSFSERIEGGGLEESERLRGRLSKGREVGNERGDGTGVLDSLGRIQVKYGGDGTRGKWGVRGLP